MWRNKYRFRGEIPGEVPPGASVTLRDCHRPSRPRTRPANGSSASVTGRDHFQPAPAGRGGETARPHCDRGLASLTSGRSLPSRPDQTTRLALACRLTEEWSALTASVDRPGCPAAPVGSAEVQAHLSAPGSTGGRRAGGQVGRIVRVSATSDLTDLSGESPPEWGEPRNFTPNSTPNERPMDGAWPVGPRCRPRRPVERDHAGPGRPVAGGVTSTRHSGEILIRVHLEYPAGQA